MQRVSKAKRQDKLNIFIELPSWLGDAVMTTAAIENIKKSYPDANITFFGSPISCEIFKPHPNAKHFIIDETKKSNFRLKTLFGLAKTLPKFDLAISFRSSFYSKALLYLLKSKYKYQYNKKNFLGHQVEKYCTFLNECIGADYTAGKLKLYFQKLPVSKTKLLGINPGATYGSAKRWYADRFSLVAKEFSNDFKILIFGSKKEIDIANDIEKELKKSNIKNYENLAGKTDIKTLAQTIAALDLFITNDSGPMHIACAYQIPTVAIFGPTNDKETSQWKNKKSKIIKKKLPCAPCMKRKCPLKTHECMKKITAEDVIKEAKVLIAKNQKASSTA